MKKRCQLVRNGPFDAKLACMLIKEQNWTDLGVAC